MLTANDLSDKIFMSILGNQTLGCCPRTIYIYIQCTCDKFKKGIREVLFSFQGVFSKMYRIYRKIVNLISGRFPDFVKKNASFRRNLTRLISVSLPDDQGVFTCMNLYDHYFEVFSPKPLKDKLYVVHKWKGVTKSYFGYTKIAPTSIYGENPFKISRTARPELK